MDLDLERITFGTVVGVTGATVTPRTGRNSNQQIDLSEKFDEIARPNGTCFHEVLVRVARIASAHEYVHHVVNMNLSFLRAVDSAAPRAPAPNLSDGNGGIPSPSIAGWYRGRIVCR